ncbi:hypothetical protein AVEN_143377-1 [Araneus ventricosus]|uniref:Uncharacterized protein n=1 Tax=Araneus ventricosus TaxID=182803 RepID=A0A4Y2AE66_ARAVE|nr:hypothetical protein AVEN_143377-1 [Araneus ventricosus]
MSQAPVLGGPMESNHYYVYEKAWVWVIGSSCQDPNLATILAPPIMQPRSGHGLLSVTPYSLPNHKTNIAGKRLPMLVTRPCPESLMTIGVKKNLIISREPLILATPLAMLAKR